MAAAIFLSGNAHNICVESSQLAQMVIGTADQGESSRCAIFLKPTGIALVSLVLSGDEPIKFAIADHPSINGIPGYAKCSFVAGSPDLVFGSDTPNGLISDRFGAQIGQVFYSETLSGLKEQTGISGNPLLGRYLDLVAEEISNK